MLQEIKSIFIRPANTNENVFYYFKFRPLIFIFYFNNKSYDLYQIYTLKAKLHCWGPDERNMFPFVQLLKLLF